MKKFAIIGLGRFGSRLAQLLTNEGAEVIAVDANRALIDQLRDTVTLAVCLDSMDPEALKAQGIDKVDVAVVGIGADFESAALTTSVLKNLGVARVITRATTNTRAAILSRIGADDIVNPEREAAERWKSRLLAPSVLDSVELAEGYTLTQVQAPPSFYGKSLAQLQLRRKYKVNVVAIRRTDEEVDVEGIKRSRQYVISVPMAETIIKENDVLLLIGSEEACKDFPSAE
ncbi:MAG: potassium channel family protein [Phycisphaerae bacterium]